MNKRYFKFAREASTRATYQGSHRFWQALDEIHFTHTRRNLRLFVVIVEDVIILKLCIVAPDRNQCHRIRSVSINVVVVQDYVFAFTDNPGIVFLATG